MYTRSIYAIMFAAVTVTAMSRAVSAENTDNDMSVSEVLVRQLKDAVSSNWDKLSKWCRQTLDYHEELPKLDETAPLWFPDKKSRADDIRNKLEDIRGLLLSNDAKRIMKRIEECDKRLEDINKKLQEERENHVLYPEKRAKIEERMNKLCSARDELQRQRDEFARNVLKELDALGLRLSGTGAEKCLFPANIGDLIDNVIVAKSIAIVVANLRELMAGGDVSAAKRYFGMYVVMVEVQKYCFEQYLEKSRNGEWRKKLNQIREEAIAVRDEALKSAQDMSFAEQHRNAFRANAKVNENTLKAVAIYEKTLDAHEKIIESKENEAGKMFSVAQNSYKTVSLAGDFFSLVKSSQESFDALLELQLPPIEIINDTSLQEKFMEITKKLKEKE